MSYFWDNAIIVLYLMLAVLIVDNAWILYLLMREMKAIIAADAVPQLLQPYLGQELYARMRDYKCHKTCFKFVHTLLFDMIAGFLELFCGLYAWLWSLALSLAYFEWMENELWVSIVYALLLSLYLFLKSLPSSLYESYCIVSLRTKVPEKRLWKVVRGIFDALLMLLLTVLVVVLLVGLVLMLGNYSFIAMFLLSVMLTSVLILLVPLVIDPYMGKRVPLQNAALQKDLEKVTESVGFPMRQVYIIKTHDANAGSNAFFYGCCCLKRIVIFDTLLLNRGLQDTTQLSREDVGRGLTNAQVVAVVAHELGHWKHGHFYKSILLFKLHMLLTLLLFGLCFPHAPIYMAIGFAPGVQPIIVGILITFAFVLTPYITIANYIMLCATRHFEYQADRFAFRLGYSGDLRNALMKLYADNLSFPISDALYSSWNHTHPGILSRLERLQQLEQSSHRS